MKKVVICIITTLILLVIVFIFFVFFKNSPSSSRTLIETMTNQNQNNNNNNKWSQETIKNFLHFQKTYNPLYIFDISILQTQATEQDVEYLLQNNRWPWTNETKKQFKDAIAHNEIIQVDPGIALDQSQSVYNETAMKQILYWNTAEGKFLLYGGLTKDGNILRCSQDAKNMEVIHNLGYGPANPHKSIPNDEIQTIFPPFRFLQSNTNNSCNPCIKINDPFNNSCPFTLSF
jgi:hypothetical protein